MKFQGNSMELINNERLTKILTILAFTFITLSLVIIAIIPPASGYEISIYDSYPWYFWWLILISIFLGQIIILKNVFFKSSDENNRLWFLGLIVIMISIIIILFLPYIRAYPTYGRFDHLTHIGIVRDILEIGRIEKTNFYPNLHILTASLSEVPGCGVVCIANFLSRFFFFLFPISMYLFFRTIFKKKNEMKLALVLASSFLFFGNLSTHLAQCPQSFLLLPLIFYLYFKRGDSKNCFAFSLLFVIFISSYNFYHPLNSLLLILVFIFLAINLYFYPKVKGEYQIIGSETLIKKKALSAILFTLAVFLVWYSSFSSIIGSFKKVFSSIFYGSTGSYFKTQAAIVSSYTPRTLDIIEIAIYRHGSNLIIGVVSIFCLIYTFFKWHRNKKRYKLRFCLLFSGLIFLAFSILSAAAFFTDFIVGWGRFYRWAVFFSFILISLTFYNIIIESKDRAGYFRFFNKSFKTISICLLLILLLFLSTFTFFVSPKIKEPNAQVTSMKWEGMNWFFTHRNEQNLIDELGISQERFSHAINGMKDNKISIRFKKDTAPPDHFGYENSISLGENYNESRYIIITHLGKISYPELYPSYQEYWRFTSEDFHKLQNDDTVIIAYSNGGIEMLLTRTNEV